MVSFTFPLTTSSSATSLFLQASLLCSDVKPMLAAGSAVLNLFYWLSKMQSAFTLVASPLTLSPHQFPLGHHASLRHHQWKVLRKHQELDTKHRRGRVFLHLQLAPLHRCCFSCGCRFIVWPPPLPHSTPQQMWRGWSWGTNVTSMTSGRSLKSEERRWSLWFIEWPLFLVLCSAK